MHGSIRSARLSAVLGVAIAVALGTLAVSGAARPHRAAAALGDRGPADAPRVVSARVPRSADPPATDAFDPNHVTLGLSLVASGFVEPLLVTGAGDGSGRLFVVERAGRIRVLSGGAIRATPLLDLRGAISSGGERGLLGLAFDPKFPADPYIYVNFTDVNGDTAISRYTIGPDPNVAVRSTGVRILTISQPYANHNGGNLAFGPHGDQYVGTGDGGSSGDPGNRAQNLDSLLGKLLRLDVHHGTRTTHYVIPASNPFVGRSGNDLVWSRGLRNPWRWSFDRGTGALWIGDVGQDRYEEIDRSSPQPTVGAGRGVNYGWRVVEGRACYNPPSGCSTTGMQAPLVAYSHAVTGDDNCSVTGGFVYRGTAYPVLAGGYVFGDFCSGRMWLVSAGVSSPATPVLVRDATASPRVAISSFGESDTGELYVTDLGGAVYRVTARAKP
ncbi:MAG: hypothetical protein QOF49_2201 [Chloroflexota bacterium]|nr:hypothetical protein [Chloroflexota bacterium]